jgi:S-adenosylmethionine:tRNA ribosyltransferase-isomerase
MLVDPLAGTLAHEHFAAFAEQLRSGDVLVVNETRVIRARLQGRRDPGGGRAEILLVHPAGATRFDPSTRRWIALVKPGRKLREGARVLFGEGAAARIEAVLPDGTREITLELNLPFEDFLERHGELPLPPYVGPGDERRAQRYQTIFAREPGSVAAPTASLHFTPAVLKRILERGVEVVPLVLEVGLATFKPIEAQTIDAHVMHRERYAIPAATAAAVNLAKRERRRVVAAGTTVLRALESAAISGEVAAGEGETELFISPGFQFRVADALLTNFHLPASSLLVLVSAFAGYDLTRAAYTAAIAERYRFFSFGDAMFITPPASTEDRSV